MTKFHLTNNKNILIPMTSHIIYLWFKRLPVFIVSVVVAIMGAVVVVVVVAVVAAVIVAVVVAVVGSVVESFVVVVVADVGTGKHMICKYLQQNPQYYFFQFEF